MEACDTWTRELPLCFHTLCVAPPLTVLWLCLPRLSLFPWFPIWYVMKAVLPVRLGSLGGHAVTIYACYDVYSGTSSFASDSSLLLTAVATGLVMGITFRNITNAARWIIVGAGRNGVSDTTSANVAKLVPPRSPSVLVPVPAVDRRAGGVGEFTVKVMLPTAKFEHGMVYNERKTLQCFVDLEDASQPAMATLVRLIARGGGGGGIRGYFAARREGEALRIFVDRMLPEPARPW